MKIALSALLSLAVLITSSRAVPTVGNSTALGTETHDDETYQLEVAQAEAEDVDGFEESEHEDLLERFDDDFNQDEALDVNGFDNDSDLATRYVIDLDTEEHSQDFDWEEHDLSARDLVEELEDDELLDKDDENDTDDDDDSEFEFGHELTEREAEYELEGFDEEDSVLAKRAGKSGHMFYFVNKCKASVRPAFADTRCGYSPRCKDATAYKGKKPGVLKPGKTSKYKVPNRWVGRVFNAQNKRCGAKGENCSMAEFNLDTGSQWTPQAYDISNIQGFTQALGIKGEGCAAVACRSVKCSCKQAYPPGDMAGKCGTNAVDQPVRACGKGPKAFRVTFCP